MASTSYLARVIYREHAEGGYAGQWKLLVRAKSIPSPIGTPNNVESTTLEDSDQTFEPGIRTSDSLAIVGNLEKTYYDALDDLEGKELDLMFLYGTDGVGSVLKVARSGKVVVSPNDIGGVDEILEMTVTVTPSSSAKKVTDDVTVTDGKDGTFTVAAA